MKDVIEGNTYRRDFKQVMKRGKNKTKLMSVVATLAAGKPLAPRHFPHPLKGKWSPCWECHIEPDWLLLYETSDHEVHLIRTGTHSDLFK
jgi:mRNA interferase YafQ